MVEELLEKIHGNYSKLSNLLLVIALLSYLAGFIISNIYFGFFGFVNLDLLKAKYILIGLLFFLFVGLIIYLIYGLILIIKDNRNSKLASACLKMLQYTVTQFLFIFIFLGSLVVTLSGSENIIPSGIPNISHDIDLFYWTNSLIQRIYSGLIPASFIILFFLIFFFAIWFWSKESKNLETKKRFTSSLKKSTFITFVITLFIMLFLITMDLISFIRYGVNNHTYGGSNNIKGILYFFLGIISFYLFVSIILLLIFITLRRKPEEKIEEKQKTEFDKFTNIYGSLFFTILFISVVLPIYTLRIFPEIPQQIGGGKLIEVKLHTNKDSLNNIINKSNNFTFLLDHSSTNTFIILTDTLNKTIKTIDISNSVIENFIYPEKSYQNK